MALPSSGAISMAMVAAEIGISASGLSLNDSRVRQLAGKPSGAVSFADLRGKAWAYLNGFTVSKSVNRWRNGYVHGEDNIFTLTVDSNTSWTASASISDTRRSQVVKNSENRFTVSATFRGGGPGTIYFTVTGAGKTLSSSASYSVYMQDDYPYSCFTGECLVLMADGSTRRIDSIVAGEKVRTAVGTATVTQVDTPILGHRTLYSFKGGMKTSGEHSVWSRNRAGEQWWATHDMEQWLYEAASGNGPNFDQLPYDLTGGNLLWDYATVDGWSTEAAQPVPAARDTQLYHLLLDTGGSYFVNGYLVSSMADSGGVDWHNFTWR